MTSKLGALAIALMASPAVFALLLLIPGASAEPVIVDLDVSTDRVIKDTSFIVTGNITVRAGGRLTLDNVSIQMRMDIDNSREIRVQPGGELLIVNGTRIYAQFESAAFALHYRVFVDPGGRFTLQNSTIDYPYWVGVGDEGAVIENSTISHSLMALHGSNLTADHLTIFSTTVGFWLSGHSVLRHSRVEDSAVYGGILDGTSRVENSSFTGSIAADLALLDSAVAVDTTHANSGRAAILQNQSSITRASIENMTIAGVQLGDEDFKYGCGIFVQTPNWAWPDPAAQWLNLHLFPIYYRVNNTVALTDVSISGTPTAIAFARDAWRRAMVNDSMDDCRSDPPAPVAAQPLYNRVTLAVNTPQLVSARDSRFNGSIDIRPGGSLTIRGADWKFISAGEPHLITVSGGALSLEGAMLTTGLINYTSDALNESRALTPNFDIRVNAGTLGVFGSFLRDLGTSSDPAVDAGIVVAGGAGPLDVADSTVTDSLRGITVGLAGATVGAANRVRIESSALTCDGPCLVVRGGNISLLNSTLASNASAPIRTDAGATQLHFFGSEVGVSGPGTASIYRYGFVRARLLWEDLRPAGGQDIVVRDFATGAVVDAMPTAADGWADPRFILFQNTTWDGFVQQGGPVAFFVFSAVHGNATATSLPVDISAGATITLTLPDVVPPTVTLNLPAEFYTNLSGGVVTGVAEDFETGVTVVERSLDGGPFLGITAPSTPQLGPVNFSFTLTALPEGVHVVAVRAWDSVGNTAEASAYFIVDQTFPRLKLDFPFDLTTNQRLVVVTGRLSESGTITIKGNTTNASNVDGSFSLPLTLDRDSENIEVACRDLAGNAISYFFVARLDQVPPQLEITSPADGAWVATPRVLLAGLLEFNAQLELNGVPLTISGVSNFTITAALSEGENLLELTAIDLAGNRHTVTRTLYLDSSTPPLEVISPDAARSLPSRDVNLTMRTEPGAVVTVGNVSATANGSYVTLLLHLSEGRNLLSIQAADRAGNSVLRGLALTVDTVAPTLNFTGGNATSTSNATYFLTGITEPGALVTVGEYTVQADSTGGFSMPVRLHPGENRLPVTARDAAGNSVSGTFTISVAEPPRAQAPGLAAPSVGASLLLILGVAACLLGPVTVRFLVRRRA